MKKGRYPKVQAEKREEKKKGGWSKEEDQKLAKFINDRGLNGFTWETISRKAGLNRCAKSCRLRWKNYLDPHIRRGNFSKEEESTIIRLHSRLGKKWSQIAAQLPGRTDNDIKNFWNTKLRKQLDQKAANTECSLPRTATTVANYLLGTLSILLGFLNMPLSEIAQNLLVQELWERMQQAMIIASTPNYPFQPDNSTVLQPGYGLGNGLYNENNAIPFEVHTNSTSDAWLGGGLSANFIDSNVAGMSSNYDLTEYDMFPALVSATGDEIPMPMADEFYVDLNSVASIDYEWILNEMNYQSPDHLGSAMQENQILASCLDLSPSFMDSPSSSEIYDGAS